MRQLTQTSLDPGNCWQTCVACILDVDPEELPPQIQYDLFETDADGHRRFVSPSYPVLQAYLRVHHGLAYIEVYQPIELWDALTIKPAAEVGRFHMTTGRTVRTEKNHSRHVVVSEQGTMIWDPHPSRAGLLSTADGGELHHAFLVPFPKSWDKNWHAENACVCPSCAARDVERT